MSDPAPRPSILITGANGFIGSRLCALFLTRGFQVVAGVRRSSDLTLLKDLAVQYRFGDVTEPESIPAMVRDVDYIIHNAGVVKAKSQATFFAVNANGTAQLMSGILESNQKVKKVVLISSMAAAGPSLEGRPTTEEDAPHPMTTYGASKLAGEREFLKHTADLNLVILRPSGVYGPGDKEMMTVFQTARRGIRPCFGDTTRRIQLVHVDDLCRGIMCAVEKQTKSGEAYFIAEKKAYSLAELVELVCKAVGRRGFPLVVPGPLFRLIAAVSEFSFQLVGATPMLTREKAGELLASWEISTDKARRDLGFESQVPFEEGAKQTYEWYRQHGWM
jgi:2-alkyl-3-oxoalkanoate reductase